MDCEGTATVAYALFRIFQITAKKFLEKSYSFCGRKFEVSVLIEVSEATKSKSNGVGTLRDF